MGATDVTDTVTALVSVLDAALNVPVFDSFALTAQYPNLYVIVANNDDPDTIEAATYDQTWSNTAETARFELGRVACVIVAWSGGADFAALRTQARDTANQIDTTLKANPTLSGAVMRADYGLAGVLKQHSDTEGINVRLTFTIDYQTTA